MAGYTISSLDEVQYNQVVLKETEQREFIESKSLNFENEYKMAEKLAMENLNVPEDNTKGQDFVEYIGGSFKVARGRGSYYARQTSMKNWLTEKYPDIAFNKRFARYIVPVVVDADTDKYKELVDDVERIVLANKLLALVDPLSSLAWISLEERF